VQSKQKMSFIERQLNNFMVFIVLMQCAIAIGAGLLGTFYEYAENKSFLDSIIGKQKDAIQSS
jgi:magnesium-transporting ATPase (P-type)